MAVELSESAKRKLKRKRQREEARQSQVGSGAAQKATDTVARTQRKREARLDAIMAEMRKRQATDDHQ